MNRERPARRAIRPPARRPGRPGRLPVLLLLVGLLLAGCATVPSGGPAVKLRDVPPGAAEDNIPDVRLRPRGPGQGDSPDRIVRGFLAAAKSSAGEHAIARDFLTPSAAATWRDDAGVQIVVVGDVSATKSGAEVTVTGRTVARLEADGSYVAMNRPLQLTLAMRKVQGEWRIDNPPPGILLAQSDFTQVYRAVDLYFLAPDGQVLVPDRRYFDVALPALPSVIVSHLLAGPSAALAPGVRTAFPSGTVLKSNVVQAPGRVDQELTVDLSQQADEARGTRLTAMAAQLAWTLRRFGRPLRLSVEGRQVRLPDGSELIPAGAYQGFDPDVLTRPVTGYLISAGRVRRSTGPDVPGPLGQPGAGVLSADVSLSESSLAAVRRSGAATQLLVGPMDPAAPPVRLTAPALASPTFFPDGGTVLVLSGQRQVLMVPPTGPPAAVQITGVPAGPLTRITLSRDGVRVAVLAGGPGAGTLYVGVLRASGGANTAITGLTAITPDLTDVRDVAWASASSLLVVARQGGAAPLPYLVSIDGATITARPADGLPGAPTAVAAAPHEPDLVAAGGQVLQRTGNAWVSPLGTAPLTGDLPFYP